MVWVGRCLTDGGQPGIGVERVGGGSIGSRCAAHDPRPSVTGTTVGFGGSGVLTAGQRAINSAEEARGAVTAQEKDQAS